MKEPFFSVIIPTYNSQNSIIKTLDSLYFQTFKDFEIILIDDCSWDHTVEFSTQYFEKFQYINIYTKIIQLPINTGVSNSRNVGNSIARGKYIAFMDSDDIFHYNRLLIVYNILIKNSEYKFIYNLYTDEKSNFSKFQFTKKIKLKKLPLFYLLLKNPIQTSTVIIQKESLIYFDTAMRYCEDYSLWLTIGIKTDIYCLPMHLTLLGRPQLSLGGLSGNKKAMHYGEIIAFKKFFSEIGFFYLFPIFFIYSKIKYLKKIIKSLFVNLSIKKNKKSDS
jgi:teichuronic acid biosynthesis glycosyltransferase TuaG